MKKEQSQVVLVHTVALRCCEQMRRVCLQTCKIRVMVISCIVTAVVVFLAIIWLVFGVNKALKPTGVSLRAANTSRRQCVADSNGHPDIVHPCEYVDIQRQHACDCSQYCDLPVHIPCCDDKSKLCSTTAAANTIITTTTTTTPTGPRRQCVNDTNGHPDYTDVCEFVDIQGQHACDCSRYCGSPVHIPCCSDKANLCSPTAAVTHIHTQMCS